MRVLTRANDPVQAYLYPFSLRHEGCFSERDSIWNAPPLSGERVREAWYDAVFNMFCLVPTVHAYHERLKEPCLR